MNTPSHAILNLALLAQVKTPAAESAVLIGAILPDLPIFGFYFWQKFVRRRCDRQIWSEIYWQPNWQRVIALFHSIPLAAIAWVIAAGWHWQWLQLLSLSLILHSLLDLPVHNDDAHRHFYPFSHYRLISPISYWDARYHGRLVSFVERLLVLLTTLYLFPRVQSPIGQGSMVIVNGLYFGSYLWFGMRQRRSVGVVNQCASPVNSSVE